MAGAPDKVYVVQTSTAVVSRCILMSTDPGDLVLDPTCGSGTTSSVAEQWGRRWITIDTSSIALSAGAFSLSAAVYLFGLKRFQPIARTATFVGLIGYTMAMLALILDIGRPDRF